MSITLNGTTGISSPGGDTSVSLATTNLSYTGTLTGGTGVIAIGTNQIYKDSSGNVGIGTPNPSYPLDIRTPAANIYVAPSTTTNNALTRYVNAGGTGFVGLDGSAGGLGYAYGLHLYHTGAYPIVFSTNNTARLTIDSSGNLGLGVTPQARLDVLYTDTSGPSASGNMVSGAVFSYAAGGTALNIGSASGYSYFNSAYRNNAGVAAAYRWYQGATQAMTLDASGYLIVGAPSNFGTGIQSKSTSASSQSFTAWNAVDSGNAYLFYGGTGSASFTARYQIYWNFTSGTGTAGFLSDYRQKDNVRGIVNGLDTVNALKPSIYRFKDATQDASGFIAHEVQAVIPQAVSGHKDEVDEDGNPKYQMLDQVHIIPYLTAAIQELTTRLEALENK